MKRSAVSAHQMPVADGIAHASLFIAEIGFDFVTLETMSDVCTLVIFLFIKLGTRFVLSLVYASHAGGELLP
jgi:hypothetical protein